MKRGFVRGLLLVIAASVFLLSSVMVFKYRLELRAGTKYAENIAQAVVIPVEAPVNKAVSQPTAEPAADAPSQAAEESSSEAPAGIEEEVFNETFSDPPVEAAEEIKAEAAGDVPVEPAEESETKPVRVAPIQVDFDALLAENPDVVAWLYCPDTPINYPVVQAEDNDYYMHRLLDGSKSYPGTLFMDYRNTEDFSDWNSVIYGHNMRNDSMFGTLPDYKEKEYFDAHPEIYLLTPQRDYVINVLAGFVTPNNSELYNALRPEDAEKESLLKDWLDAADFAAEEYPAPEERLITLSTCSYEYKNARYVLIGSLEELGV